MMPNLFNHEWMIQYLDAAYTSIEMDEMNANNRFARCENLTEAQSGCESPYSIDLEKFSAQSWRRATLDKSATSRLLLNAVSRNLIHFMYVDFFLAIHRPPQLAARRVDYIIRQYT